MSTKCWICEKKKQKTKFRPMQLIKVRSRVCKDCEKRIDQELEREKMPIRNIRYIDRGVRRIRKTTVKSKKEKEQKEKKKKKEDMIAPLTLQLYI